MNKSKKFSPEVRERAVRMVQEHRGGYPSLWAAIESIAPKIGCVPQTLLSWVQRHEIDTGVRHGVTTADAQRVKELEREVKELRRANEILKLASAFFAKAELDRRLKSGGSSSTNTAAPTGSSRSARFCRSPRRDTDATQPFGATPNSAVPGSKGTKCWCPRSSASGRPICRSTEPTRCAGGLKKGRPNGPTAKQPNSADHAGLDSHQPASTKPGCFTRRQGLLL
jgi:transposase